MPGEADVKQETDSSSESDSLETKDSSSEKKASKAGAGSDKSEEGEDSEGEGGTGEHAPVPYKRFQQVNSRMQETEGALRWYQEQIPSADELVEFKKWQKEQKSKPKDDKPGGSAKAPLKPEEIATVRDWVLEAVPELKELQGQRKTAAEAMFDLAEEEVSSLAKEHGMPTEDAFMNRLGGLIMNEIRADEKLLRMWETGNVKAVTKAFEIVNEHFLKFSKKESVAAGKLAADKRRMSRLPTAPAGKSTLGSKTDHLKGKGLTKEVHDAAWELMQQANES